MHTEAEELELRLKVLTELNNSNEKVNLQSLVLKYGVTYPKLLRWRKEYEEARENNAVDKLIQLDSLVVNRILDEVEQDAIAAMPEDTAVVEDTIDSLKAGITGLQLLNTEVQQAALNLIAKTNALIITEDESDVQSLTPADIQRLATVVTGIQNAFFNKNGTHVQINNLQGDAMVSAFKGRLVN